MKVVRRCVCSVCLYLAIASGWALVLGCHRQRSWWVKQIQSVGQYWRAAMSSKGNGSGGKVRRRPPGMGGTLTSMGGVKAEGELFSRRSGNT